MFTLLPALYLIGADFLRQWKTLSPVTEVNRKPTAAVDCQDPSSLAVPQRRTVKFQLNETEISDLASKTSFNREQILAWHADFLVGDQQG